MIIIGLPMSTRGKMTVLVDSNSKIITNNNF